MGEGVTPRTKLDQLRELAAVGERHGLAVNHR